MKKILITGVNSYIGNAFKEYMKNFAEEFQVDCVGVSDGDWAKISFKGYDAVCHVAGIAHRKETKDNADLYFKVNHILTVEIAAKAKTDGVKQFIFLSTMSVYGMDTGVINRDTQPNPKTNYGKSKYRAEQDLILMQDDGFKIAIIRPPMVYGKGCKGNFQTLLKIAEKFPVFPKVNNNRSMIYIDNLSEFIKIVVEKEACGIFFPQNKEYANTSRILFTIGEAKGKKIHLSGFLGFLVLVLRPFSKVIRKAFGSLVYKDTEIYGFDYCKVAEKESIKNSL